MQKYFDENGDLKEDLGILTDEDVYALSKTAVIDGVSIEDEAIYAESVFAQSITGLVARFGSVKADNITGNSISGLVFKSAQDCTFTEETNSDIIRD